MISVINPMVVRLALLPDHPLYVRKIMLSTPTSELSYGALFTPAYPKSYDLLPLAPVICCVPGTAHVLKSESKLPRSGDFGKS